MADKFTIEVDTRELLAALDAIPDAVLAELKLEAKATAENIARDARLRVRRRTGRTGDAITVEEARDGKGYVVFIGADRSHIGHFLEWGTKFMTAKPFLMVSARLEEGSHDRRSREAIQRVINARGLGA